MPSGQATRAQLVAVAERLFAERGIEAVSLREIGAAAGQRNNSATQYHFKSRDALVDAIFETRMTPIDRRRRAMLAEVEANALTSDLRALSKAFVLPLAFAVGDQLGVTFYARFLAQVVFDPHFDVLSERRHAVTGGLRRVMALLHDAVPEQAPPITTARLSLAAGLVVHSLADRERAVQAGRGHPHASFDLFGANLVDAMVGLLSAPASPATHQALATIRLGA